MLLISYLTIKSFVRNKMSSNNEVKECCEVKECPICMEKIEANVNQVITECGHTFHCKCLMQNITHNGYGCPYCRTKMAEEVEEEEEEEEEDDEEDEDDWTEYSEEGLEDHVFTSFRMFFQQLNGEEVEEEEEDDYSYVTEVEREIRPNAEYITSYLLEKGINMVDVLKNLLWLDESEFGNIYSNYEGDDKEIYKHIRNCTTKYKRELKERQEADALLVASTNIDSNEVKEEKEEEKVVVDLSKPYILYNKDIEFGKKMTTAYTSTFHTLPLSFAKIYPQHPFVVFKTNI